MITLNPIRVAKRLIGPGLLCFMVAEIGINHNGDMRLARAMIDAAVKAGADAVKFQNYRTEDFLSDRSSTYSYKRGKKTITESQFDMFKRCELSTRDLAELAAHCKRRKVIFFSTPTSAEGVRELQKLRVPLLKNGSDYLGNLSLIRTMARTKIPTVLSTGMATVNEIDSAVHAFRHAGGFDLILLHCVSSYPAPPSSVHLRKIPALAAAFGCPVGFSDHTEGIVAALGAVALGACFIEKHFTTDCGLPGPDQELSSDPVEFGVLVRSVRLMEQCLGESRIGPSISEAKNRRKFRLSCIAARDLKAGHRMKTGDVVFRRPGTGLPPSAIEQLLNRKLIHTVSAGYLFSSNDFR